MKLLLPMLILAMVVPAGAAAQAASKIKRMCVLSFEENPQILTRFALFFRSMRDLGYIEGRNIAIDLQGARGNGALFPELPARCVEGKSDVIVVTTTPAAHAAKKATSTIPIIMHPLGDPVGSGLVASLARPAGNITGLTFMAEAMSAKRLSLLKEVFPRVSRVMVFSYLSDPIAAPQVAEMQKAADGLGIRLHVHEIRKPDDYENGFDEARKVGAEAVIATSESISFNHRALINRLAEKQRMPTMMWAFSFVESGSLLSYGPDFDAFIPRTAHYVDRVLKGADPANMPIERPTKFVLAVNLKTARAIGVTIPQTFMLRADRVIE